MRPLRGAGAGRARPVRDVDLGGRDVVASDTRRKLLAGIEPLFRAAVDRPGFFAGTPVTPDALLAGSVEVNGRHLVPVAYVQLHPAVLRLCVAGLPRSVEVERLPLDMAPGLEEAAQEAIGAVLTMLGEEATEDAIAAAEAVRGTGGFLLRVELVTARVHVLLARPGEDLGRALNLGGIVDKSEGVLH